jgi:hypothetical protein
MMTGPFEEHRAANSENCEGGQGVRAACAGVRVRVYQLHV